MRVPDATVACPGCGETLSVPITLSGFGRDEDNSEFTVNVSVDAERFKDRLDAHLAKMHPALLS